MGLATLHRGLTQVNSERTAKGGDCCGDFTGVRLCASEVLANFTGGQIAGIVGLATLHGGLTQVNSECTAKGGDSGGDFTGVRCCAS